MRGLHGELRQLQRAIYSKEEPPAVTIDPAIEHLVRRANGKTLIVAATTHGLSFGNWRWTDERADASRVRVTADPHVFRDESDGYHATGEPATQSLYPHGIQYLVHPQSRPAGTQLVTWVKLDPQSPPRNLAALVKADGRWTHAGTWGSFDVTGLRADEVKAYWFLRTFYRHARGFLGWGDNVPAYAREFIPGSATALGALPAAGDWVKLEVLLDKLGASGKLLDKRYAQYLSEALWQPIGAVDAFVVLDSEEHRSPRYFCCLNATARSWLRVGLLHLNAGRVNGTQVVPESWMRDVVTPSPTNPNYGYLTWLGTEHQGRRYYNSKTSTNVYHSEPFAAKDLIYFDGFGGQRVYVVPSLGLVIVRTGSLATDWDDAKLTNLVIRGIRDRG